MPAPSQYILPKTTDSREFENMVKDCAFVLWQQPFTLYGVNGQSQYGIDIFSDDWTVVIQCKNYVTDRMTTKNFTDKVNEDYKSASEHFTNLRCFVIATAINRNNKTQDYIRDIPKAKNSKSEDIKIEVLFWDDIQEIIASNQDLLNKYYPLPHNKSHVFTANLQYAKSFREVLFLHKRDGDTRVNLVNLFVMQKYEEEDYNQDNDYKGKIDLPQRLAQFVQDARPYLFIEGNAGCGKSSLIGWLNHHYSLHDSIAQQILGDRPLVTIRLRDLNREIIRLKKGLMSAILKYMHIETVDEFERTFPNAVVVLDGFDELCMIEGISDYESLIYDFYGRYLDNFKFIITARPKYIRSGINVPHYFLTLQHFDSDQRREWLFRYTSPRFCGQNMDEQVKAYIEGIDDFADSAICDTPMTLYMLAAKDISIEIINNSWRLYHHIFYEELSETEYNQMFHDPNRNYAHDIIHYRDIVYRINEEIAYRMYCSKNNKFYLSSKELREIIKKLSKHDINLRSDAVKLIAERCYALCTYWKARSEDGAVEFYHNNIRDFFLCEKIFRELNSIYKNQDPHAIQITEILNLCCNMFKYNSLETMVCQFMLLRTMDDKDNNRDSFPIIESEHHFLKELFEKMLEDGTLYSNLNSENPIQTIINILSCTAQIYRHVYEPFLHENQVIKWWNNPEEINNIDILKYVFYPIFRQIPVTFDDGFILNMASKGDFSRIDFRGCDLRNIGFQNSNLTGANFSNSILCGCDFSGAILEGADFSNADIHYACLEGAKMDCCVLKEADLRGTELPDGSCSTNQDEQITHIKLMKIPGLMI